MIRNLLKGIFQPKKSERDNEKVILIIENKKKEKCFKQVLSKKRYNLLSALDGEEGIQMAQKNKLSLIILNLLFSEKKGLDLCAKLKAEKTDKNVAILVITSDKDDTAIVEYYAKGADRCLKEPVNKKTFLEQVDGLLKNRRKT